MNAKEAKSGMLLLGKDLAELAASVNGGEWEPRVYESEDGHTFDVVCTSGGESRYNGRSVSFVVRSHEGMTAMRMTARTWVGLCDRVSIAHMVALAGRNENWR